MDEKDQDKIKLPDEFDLEDILREFGGGEPVQAEQAEPDEALTEELPEEPREDVSQEEELQEETQPESQPEDDAASQNVEESQAVADQQEDLLQETLVWDAAGNEETQDVQAADGEENQQTVTADTIRLGQSAEEAANRDKMGDTHSFEPIRVPEEAQPFTEQWEPEYEQPIGEYVPPQPIVFRPRSRLQELKRKLVNGPEKRYYELSELGVGKLQAVIFLSFLLSILSAGATVLYALNMLQPERLKLMVFGQFFAMLVAAFLGSFQLIEGVADLFHKHFTLNTMLVLTFLACCADGLLGLKELRVPCCAAFTLEMTMSLWSSYEKRITEMGQMDTLRKAVRLDSVVSTPDYYQGMPGLLREEGRIEDFMDTYHRVSKPEKTVNTYALLAFLISLGAAAIAGGLHGLSFGVQVLAVAMLASVPATTFITVSRPMAIVEHRLHKLGSVICGWQGVQGMCGKTVFPLNHEDLFPGGATSINGVKFYSDRDSDEVVAYAAALINANGSGLAPLFNQLLESRNGRHYDVENLHCYGEGGVGGEINGEPVLIGILSFMKDMGVEIPEGTRVNQAVYAAIDGELCGLFAISYEKDRDAAAGLSALCGFRGLNPLLISGDFMLTASFIRGRFGTGTKKMGFPNHEERAELNEIKPSEEAPALALMTEEGLAPAAYAVVGARALKTATSVGTSIHLLGGILGLAMMIVLAFLGSAELLTPVNMLLYQLTWMIPGFLITEWARSA